jgi:hypothetical protein
LAKFESLACLGEEKREADTSANKTFTQFNWIELLDEKNTAFVDFIVVSKVSQTRPSATGVEALPEKQLFYKQRKCY